MNANGLEIKNWDPFWRCTHAAAFDWTEKDSLAFGERVTNYHISFSDTFVPFRDDPTHHLLDVEDISNISINKLSELICGMLNSEY